MADVSYITLEGLILANFRAYSDDPILLRVTKIYENDFLDNASVSIKAELPMRPNR